MRGSNVCKALSIMMTVVCAATVAQAAVWSKSNVQFLYGQSYEKGSGESDGNIMTLEHNSGWEYGDNYFFVDFANFDRDSVNLYGEWCTRLSLFKIANKLSGSEISAGPVADVLAVGQMDLGDGFRAYMAGVGAVFSIPYVNYFSVDVKYRDNPNADGNTYQVTPVWDIPFSIGPARFDFTGFLDWTGREDSQPVSILTQPQLLLDLGNFWGAPDRLYAGAEFQYWSEKFVFTDDGIDYAEEKCLQAIVKWVF